MDHQRRSLGLPGLSTIKDILAAWGFLKYSTQKRNMAAWILYEEFLVYLHVTFDIDRGVEKLYRYNMLRVRSDIVEAALFRALTQQGFHIPKDAKARNLVDMAKKRGLISKNTAKLAIRIVDCRNNLHANKQQSLHIKVDPKLLDESDGLLALIRDDLGKALDQDAPDFPDPDEGRT